MRAIDAGIIAKYQSEEYTPVKLLDLELSTTLRYAACDVPISNQSVSEDTGLAFVDGDVEFIDEDVQFWGDLMFGDEALIWAPRQFDLQPISYSMDDVVDQVALTVDNRDQVLTPYFTDEAPQGSAITIRETVLDDNFDPLGAVVQFKGVLDSWELSDSDVNMVVSNELSRWNQRTLALHSASCRWKQFKGTECAYSGAATWCDRSYSRCVALANTPNFGGFRWLPSIQDKEIWWGQQWARMRKVKV